MTSRDFCYWLQGFFELTPVDHQDLNPAQIKQIKNHLAMVFKAEIDPSFGGPEIQKFLTKIHDGVSSDHKSMLECTKLDPDTIKLNC